MSDMEVVLSHADVVAKNRIIYFSGLFNENLAQKTITDLLRYENEDPTKDILIIIDSYGGQVDSFMAIHDAIKLCRCDVATLCLGKAMSCGQMLLISGTKGKRFITRNSRVLVHAVSSFNWGNIHQIENDVKELKRIQKVLEGMIVSYTDIKPKHLTEIMSKDSYLSAEEAVKLGLVDYVVKNNKEIYDKIKI